MYECVWGGGGGRRGGRRAGGGGYVCVAYGYMSEWEVYIREGGWGRRREMGRGGKA